MSAAKQPPTSLAIVGGGTTGVLLALSISTHAPQLLPITLYESASKFGEIGAGVAFGPSAVRSMTRVGDGVRRGFEKCATGNGSPSKSNTYFDFWEGMRWDAGVPKARLDDDSSTGAPGFITSIVHDETTGGMVHRASFLDEMVALLPEGVKVQFKKRLVGLEEDRNERTGQRLRLRFADGSETRHSAVIGCDGIKSRTRILLLGQDDPAAHAVFSGKYCYRGLIPMDQAVEAIGKEMATNSQMYLGEHGHMLTFPVQKGKTMNVVAFASAETWEDENWVVHADREKMYRDFEGWGENVQKVLRLMQKPDIWALFNHPPSKTYCRGNLCLAGDAAHASTPHQGSGASLAIEDALVMATILKNVQKDDDFELAFATFDEVRRSRTQKLVWTSRECGQLFDFELEGTKNNIKKVAEDLEHRHLWIWDKDIDEDIREGDRVFRERQQRTRTEQ